MSCDRKIGIPCRRCGDNIPGARSYYCIACLVPIQRDVLKPCITKPGENRGCIVPCRRCCQETYAMGHLCYDCSVPIKGHKLTCSRYPACLPLRQGFTEQDFYNQDFKGGDYIVCIDCYLNYRSDDDREPAIAFLKSRASASRSGRR
jgi:hypothetical protein